MSNDGHMAYAPQPSETITMPYNTEIEAALLGAVLTNNSAYFRVSRSLREEHFYEPVHGRIFAALSKLIEQGQAGSPLTLKHYFEKDEALATVGGSQYLFDLAASVVTVHNAGDYANTIVDLWQRRELITLQRDAIEDLGNVAIESNAADIGATAARRITDVLTAGNSHAATRRDVLNMTLENLIRPAVVDPTGIARLDKAMAGGLHQARAYGFVGRKKMGKSALAGTISFNLNEAGVPHLVVLLEMGAVSYEQRNIGRALGFNSLRFLSAKSRDDKKFLNDVGNYVATAPDNVHYLNRPGLTFDEFQTQLVYHVHKHKIRGVVFDYLQLLRGRRERQHQAEFLDDVAQWIAEQTKNLGIWALVLAQENQDSNVRGGEGMRLAFDQVYAMRSAAAQRRMYLEMWDSRYTPLDDVGNSDDPAFELSMIGPHFLEVEEPEEDEKRQGDLEELANSR